MPQQEDYSCASIRPVSTARRGSSSNLGLIVVALISLVLNGCALSSNMSSLDHFMSDQGDRITYFQSGSFFGVKFTTVRSTQLGDLYIDARKASDPYMFSGQKSLSLGSVRYTVLSYPRVTESVPVFHEAIQHQLTHSLELLQERDFPQAGYSIDILIRLVPINSEFDFQRTRFFINSPKLEFVAPVDVRSADRFEHSLLEAIGTVHHELVHLASNLGWVEFPGETWGERFINEEAFATIVGRCDAFALFRYFHGSRPRFQVATQHKGLVFDPTEINSGSDWPEMNLLGRVLGLETFFGDVPADQYLDVEQLDRFLDRCKSHSQRPTNFYKRHRERK